MSVSQALNSSAIVAVVGTGAMGAGIAQVAAALRMDRPTWPGLTTSRPRPR